MTPGEAELALWALAAPARLAIVAFLAGQRLGRGVPVTNLTRVVGLTQGTVSHHLRVLADAGLVSRETSGAQRLQYLNRDRLRELAEFLARGCRS